MIREQISEQLEGALFLDPPEIFDKCIVGIASRINTTVVAYDVTKIIDALIEDGMEPEDAEEHFSFNVMGSYIGEMTPMFIYGLDTL